MENKIAFYISSLGKGGAERVVVNLAEYFRGQGYEVVIVTTYKLDEEYELPRGVNRIILGKLHEDVHNRISFFRERMKKLKKVWKAEQPDVIVSFIGKTNMMALLTNIGMKIPVFVSVRSDPNREYASKVMKMVSKTLFRRAKGIIVQTADAKAYFPKSMQKKVQILPNSLDAKFVKERYAGKRDNEIVMVGRLDANKNHKMLFEAFANMHMDYPEMKITIYGAGFPETDTEPELRKLADELGITDKITYMGRRNDIPEQICKSRIFVLASNYEGMPNALLEAMALGIACIATDCPCGGPRTVIKDGENGMLIPCGDVKALEQALRKILDNPAYEEQIGTQASKLMDELAPQKVNRMWMDYIEQGIKKC